MGLDYAANQSGCLVGYLAAKMAKKQGGKQVIGAVGGLHIPPVDIWIAGYKFCAKLYDPKIQVLVATRSDFVESDLCKTVAENQIAQGAKVLFQVAGGCGLGTLNAAAEAKIWGIGVDKDQYKDAKPASSPPASRRSTSASSRSSRRPRKTSSRATRTCSSRSRTAAWASARSTRPCRRSTSPR